ncbi:hypothetical protein HPB49_014010 [Dermacentor silvarum]|uniref:Uncharacterized protein n=1 Tax=Dermacentor silvarum TaxID=543639 RepID=A0ACB8DDM6_DERSI|nr:hypothetical protein HPB49_014010 [Dermacentor silvarum]
MGCISMRLASLADTNGAPLNLDWQTVNHSNSFVDFVRRGNTQRIESEWQKAKCRFVPNGKKTWPALLRSHLALIWWMPVNG